jgi:radical SAM protein with 4Fe4S-binding SPASM domain
VKFKTIFVDVNTEKELRPSFIKSDEDFFMPLNKVQRIFSELHTITDHLSFSLFNDVNDHPQISDIFKLAFDFGFRYDVTFLSDKFVDNMHLYVKNKSISHIEICINALETSESMNTPLKSNRVKDAILTLEKVGHHIIIDLHSTKKEDYQESTLSFLKDLGFDFEQQNWKNGFIVNLSDLITIRCCEILKEPEHELLPKKVLGRCYGAVTMLGVMSDGSVIPCNNLRGQRIKLGNIFISSMSDILTSEPFVSISDGFYKNQLVHPVCQHCPYPRKIF